MTLVPHRSGSTLREAAEASTELSIQHSKDSVNSIVRNLHILGFAEVGEWTPPLPSPVNGEVIRILTRYVNTSD